jgi:hypothetical protein
MSREYEDLSKAVTTPISLQLNTSPEDVNMSFFKKQKPVEGSHHLQNRHVPKCTFIIDEDVK